MDFRLTKEQQLLFLGLIASLVVGLTVIAVRPLFLSDKPQELVVHPQRESLLLVHICGAVGREGVYKLKPGDRVMDALALAGGPLPSAQVSALNLAEPVKDGQKIVVPARQLVAEPAGAAVGAPVNINTADEKAFDSLPGVGPATAKAMVEYRKTRGPFARPEQIMEVPRFGKSKFERIKDRITI